MLVTKEIEIDMGHRVPNHKSKCKNPHGHRYKIELGVDDKVISTRGESNEGMVIDYGDMKEILMKVINDRFDHGFVMYGEDEIAPIFSQLKEGLGMQIIFTPFIPTAENLAEHWFHLLEYELEQKRIKIKYVKVWETPTSTATYQK